MTRTWGCCCETVQNGLLQFFAPLAGSGLFRKFTRYSPLTTQQLSNSGIDGSLEDQWGCDRRDMTKRTATQCTAQDTSVLRRETVVANPFIDGIGSSGSPVQIDDDYRASRDPYEEGWTVIDGDWEKAAPVIRMKAPDEYPAEGFVRGHIATEFYSSDVTMTVGAFIGSADVRLGALFRFESWDESWKVEWDGSTNDLRLLHNDSELESEHIATLDFNRIIWTVTCNGKSVRVEVGCYNSLTPVHAFTWEAEDAGYNSELGPSKYGLFGYKSATANVEFSNPGIDASIRLAQVGNTKDVLYDTGAPSVVSDIPVRAGTLVAPDVITNVTNWLPKIFTFTPPQSERQSYYRSAGTSVDPPAIGDTSSYDSFHTGFVRRLSSGGYNEVEGFKVDSFVTVASPLFWGGEFGLLGSSEASGWSITTEEFLGLRPMILATTAVQPSGRRKGWGWAIAHDFDVSFSSQDSTIPSPFLPPNGPAVIQVCAAFATHRLMLGRVEYTENGEFVSYPTFTPVKTIDTWTNQWINVINLIRWYDSLNATTRNHRRMEVNDMRFMISTLVSTPVITEFQMLGSSGSAGWCKYSYSAISGNGLVAPNPFIPTASFNGFKVIAPEVTVVNDVIRTKQLAPSNVAMILKTGTQPPFLRIYGSGYENQHATRWSNASVNAGGDKFFYINSVRDLDDYVTDKPAGMTFAPSAEYDLYVSHDGAVRIPIVNWNTTTSQYGQAAVGLQPTGASDMIQTPLILSTPLHPDFA